MQRWSPKMTPPQLDGGVLSHFLRMWMAINVDYLMVNPNTPSVYQAGVVYVPEPPGEENWLAIPWAIEAGATVCHSLACWRAAELQVQGIDARPVWSSTKRRDGSMLYHVRVRLPNGRIEDPSLALGMGLSPAATRMFGPMHQAPAVAGLIWRE